ADDRDVVAQGCQAHLADILAIDRYTALRNVEQARYEVDESRFPGTGPSYEGDGGARWNFEGDAAQGGRIGRAIVGERDILETDSARAQIEVHGSGRIDDLRLFVEQFVKAFRSGEALLNTAGQVAKRADRLRCHEQCGDEPHEIADG